MKLMIPICLTLAFFYAGCCTTKESFGENEKYSVSQQYNDEELKLKLFLADKYRPGNCYGMPDPDPIPYQYSESDTLHQKIKTLLPGRENSEYGVLAFMVRGIQVIKTGAGAYTFQFSDGQCCTIYHYTGIIEIKEGVIEERVLDKKSETVPC